MFSLLLFFLNTEYIPFWLVQHFKKTPKFESYSYVTKMFNELKQKKNGKQNWNNKLYWTTEVLLRIKHVSSENKLYVGYWRCKLKRWKSSNYKVRSIKNDPYEILYQTLSPSYTYTKSDYDQSILIKHIVGLSVCLFVCLFVCPG